MKKHMILLMLLTVIGIATKATSDTLPSVDSNALSSAPLVSGANALIDPYPPSTLLPPGTTRLTISIRSLLNTDCRYSVREVLAYDAMTPFDSGSGSMQHQTVVSGINSDPNTVNEVYIRCAAAPDELVHLRYRCLSRANPSYPRTGNLWGSRYFAGKSLAECAKIDLWLGASFSPATIRQLRQINPDIRVLTDINAIENSDVPDDYYLRDIYGNRMEVWPGCYRLNMTRPEVAEYQARLAYQLILNSDLMFDGCFFDNVMFSQSSQNTDIYGDPFYFDSNEDGVTDDPEELDAAWKAGVLHELSVFRQLMPEAIISGHAARIAEEGVAETFNGMSLGFWTADTIEGRMDFTELLDVYNRWMSESVQPTATMIESAPPDQIAYGYGYSPSTSMPASTLAFAQNYHPYMRFGLAFTLMNDGYFTHEFGDIGHGVDWWYDELNFNLGYPLGSAERIAMGNTNATNIITNNSFEVAVSSPWSFWVNTASGCAATMVRDFADRAVGSASLRIQIGSTSGRDWHIELAQTGRHIEKAKAYEVTFWAKSDRARTLTGVVSKGSADWRGYGLMKSVAIGTGWQRYTMSFTATETAADARLQFLLGESAGTVWLDDVQLVPRPLAVYARKFSNGLVLLNPSHVPQTVNVGTNFQRLTGTQAARYEYILDDDKALFSLAGNWTTVTYDSGEWQDEGPYYHDWGSSCRQMTSAGGDARWILPVEAQDTYTIAAWWPAAPAAQTWSQSVVYEVISQGRIVASKTVSQRSGGDQWQVVAEVALGAADGAYVRVRSQDGAPCIADAIHVTSRSRYNDGSLVEVVKLQPMDGILLANRPPPPPPTTIIAPTPPPTTIAPAPKRGKVKSTSSTSRK